MKQVLSYNIHDIIKFKIIRDIGYGLRDLINLKFSFFEVEYIDDADITLIIGKFTPSKENCHIVDHKYFVKENYFFCEDVEGKAQWEVEIKGFEDGPTTINFNGKIDGFNSITNPDFVPQNFLLRFIEYKLSRKGYFLSHGAGISKNGDGYVFAGRGGTFKTSLCMDFIRRAGFEFLGDDRVIIYKDRVFAFPMGLHVFGFMCNNLQNENCWNPLNKVRFVRYLWDTKSNKNSPIAISKPSNLKRLIFIVKTNEETLSERSLPIDEAIDKLIINNRLEDFIGLGSMGINSGPLLKYILAYSYIFPDSQQATQKKFLDNILRGIIENVPINEIKIPDIYSINMFKKFQNFIKTV